MRVRSLFTAVALIACAQIVSAQAMVATAEVVIAPPVGNGTRNLSFGIITPTPGVSQVIDLPAVRNPITGTLYAGEFRFNVTGARGLDFRVAMPTQLTSGALTPLALGANGSQYGGWCVTANGSACALANFNPTAVFTRVCETYQANGTCRNNRFFSTGSELFVYIGGMLTVPSAAGAGIYTGTITISIVQVY
jgi:hypothetical protein